MGSHATWSISLGRWGGLQVRIHCFFLLFAAFTLLLGWRASRHDSPEDALSVAGVSLCILFLSVLLHELAHLVVSRRLGGDVDELVLGPLGGLTTLRHPHDALAECLIHVAGPLVNLILCLMAGLLLLVVAGEPLLPLLNPLAPANLIEGPNTWIRVSRLVFWINWVLFLVNLLPAFPFDGGRALRSALSRLRPEIGFRRSAALVALLAKVTSVALLAVAAVLLFRGTEGPTTLLPAWFALMLLAFFLYFSAKQEEERHDDREIDEELFGYDFSQGYTSLERSSQQRQETRGIVRQWWEQRRQARLERARQMEADEEKRVDEILSRVHHQGMDTLSDEDRAILHRVSERYRERK